MELQILENYDNTNNLKKKEFQVLMEQNLDKKELLDSLMNKGLTFGMLTKAVINEEPKTKDSKTRQLKDIITLVDVKTNESKKKYIIVEVYDEPKERIDYRKNNGTSIYKKDVHILLQDYVNNSIEDYVFLEGKSVMIRNLSRIYLNQDKVTRDEKLAELKIKFARKFEEHPQLNEAWVDRWAQWVYKEIDSRLYQTFSNNIRSCKEINAEEVLMFSYLDEDTNDLETNYVINKEFNLLFEKKKEEFKKDNEINHYYDWTLDKYKHFVKQFLADEEVIELETVDGIDIDSIQTLYTGVKAVNPQDFQVPQSIIDETKIDLSMNIRKSLEVTMKNKLESNKEYHRELIREALNNGWGDKKTIAKWRIEAREENLCIELEEEFKMRLLYSLL